MASKSEEKELTIERSMADFKRAYQAKRRLIEREKEDFLFSLGEQWSSDDKSKLEKAGIKPFTDNRIQPNLFLLTGLERQNRTNFKAFPEGEEDGVRANIATALFNDAVKKSGFSFKSSEQFKDGITCGESHLELYLDYSDSIINGKPCWRKCDGNTVFPDPSSREYDFSDARFIYKLTLDISRDDLIGLYPEGRKALEEMSGGKVDSISGWGGAEKHIQRKDYPKSGGESDYSDDEDSFDLIERYYKRWVDRIFVGDKKTGDLTPVEDLQKAEKFVADYRTGIESDELAYQDAVRRATELYMTQSAGTVDVSLPPSQHAAAMQRAGVLPPEPPRQDPDRFIIVKRRMPEIWCYAHVPGMLEPLADERAWFYPKWRKYPFIPFFARFSTAPLTGDDRHLLIQGLVHGVKGAQEKHNKAELLTLRHLNSTANSGWLSEEDSWVDPDAVRNFGSTPGINLEYKKGHQQPERIIPSPLSPGHLQISVDSSEAIKAQLGINSDLLATQQGGADSGRAIALRQRQGLLMVQELFDNLSRSRQIAGQLLLSQFGKIYDTESAMKILGEAFLKKNFPPLLLMNPETNQQEPMKDAAGRPMEYDRDMAEVAIAEVLSGDLEKYDVSVGEAVASETQRMANAVEIREFAQMYQGIIPPDVLIRYSQMPESAKNEILAAIQSAQAVRAQAASVTNPADIATTMGV